MIHIPHVSASAVVLGAVYGHVNGYVIYSLLFSKNWVDAMNKDKGTDKWATGFGTGCDSFPALMLKAFALSASQAWFTGLLLNLTQAQTPAQAAQLGTFLFAGYIFPLLANEHMWEKRPCDLLKFKALSGVLGTVGLSLLLHFWGTA